MEFRRTPFLISLMVSADKKHHVYILSSGACERGGGPGPAPVVSVDVKHH